MVYPNWWISLSSAISRYKWRGRSWRGTAPTDAASQYGHVGRPTTQQQFGQQFHHAFGQPPQSGRTSLEIVATHSNLCRPPSHAFPVLVSYSTIRVWLSVFSCCCCCCCFCWCKGSCAQWDRGQLPFTTHRPSFVFHIFISLINFSYATTTKTPKISFFFF